MLSIELPSLWLSFLGPKTIASLIALLAFCLESFFRRDPLRHIPGPFLARWTPLWLGYQARMGRRYIAVDNAHKKYGRVVRIAPNHISVADKDALPVVYSYGSATLEKSDFYHAFVADRPSVFSTVDRREHAQKRRLVSHAFSYEALQSFSGFIQANIEIFTGKLDEMCKAGQDIDLLTWLNYLTFDVLSDLAFGEPIGMLTNGTDIVKVQLPDGSVLEENAISLVDGREHMSAVMGIHPSFPILAKYIPDPFCIRGLKSSTGLSNFSRRRVTKRVESGAYREDILNKLILARTKESDTMSAEQLTELIAETVTLLSAGSDTTASSVAAIVHLVKTHPCVYKKLLAELESHVGHNEIPQHNQVKDLPYLQAVVDEGLRHYATMAIGLPRVVPTEGFYASGKYLPGGVEVSIPAYTIQHDEEIWGDPEVFRPERWLESEERRQYLRRYLLTFGKGPRSCLGKNLAYMETQLMLATILLRYDIELKSDVLETTEGFVHKVLHLMVKLGRR